MGEIDVKVDVNVDQYLKYLECMVARMTTAMDSLAKLSSSLKTKLQVVYHIDFSELTSMYDNLAGGIEAFTSYMEKLYTTPSTAESQKMVDKIIEEVDELKVQTENLLAHSHDETIACDGGCDACKFTGKVMHLKSVPDTDKTLAPVRDAFVDAEKRAAAAKARLDALSALMQTAIPPINMSGQGFTADVTATVTAGPAAGGRPKP